MNKYQIFETEQFQKDLEQIVRSGHSRVAQKLRDFVYSQLRGHPHFGLNVNKLKDFNPDMWWYRIGAWRFLMK